MAKLITVFGATGAQGGSVVDALLKAKDMFRVRAVTRNPTGDKAQKLKEKGVEVVHGAMDDPASLETAVAGSRGVFVVTNFWEHMDMAREAKQGRNAIDACKKANVNHLIYSGLEKVKDIIGKQCPHFDGKGEVEEYVKASGVPYTIVRYPMYYENFLDAMAFLGFQKYSGDKEYDYEVTSCMEGGVDGLSVAAAGPAIATIFKHPDKYQGKTIGLSGDKKTMAEFFKIISDITGNRIFVNQIDTEAYGKLGFPGADDIAAMFEFYAKGSPDRDISLTKELDPNTPSFATWVAQNKDNFKFNSK